MALLSSYRPESRLYPSKTRCGFTQHMLNKPGKFGIKFWLACDINSKYTINRLPYLEKDEKTECSTPVGQFVALKLMDPLSGCERRTATDNFFTSLSLAKDLLARKSSIVGTILRSSSSCDWDQIHPFLEESKVCQRLYAKCEGECPRRIFHLKHLNRLKDFISCSVYPEESYNLKFKNKVKQMADKIIETSRKFKLGDEVHIFVVQISCFNEYQDSPIWIPVFKIFKKKDGNEAVFVDLDFQVYKNWDCYLNHATFPGTLLVVPHNGEYNFVNDVLHLEYITPKNHSVDLKAVESKLYCETGIHSMFEILTKEQDVKEWITWFSKNILLKKDILIPAIAMVNNILKEKSLESQNLTHGKDLSLRLSNVAAEHSTHLKRPMNHSPAGKGQLIDTDIRDVSEILKRVLELINCTKETSKDWPKIIKLSLSIFLYIAKNILLLLRKRCPQCIPLEYLLFKVVRVLMLITPNETTKFNLNYNKKKKKH